MRILLVEDQAELSGIMRNFLHSRGFAIDTVECGEEALAAVEAADYDGVILDLGLPRMDGMEVLSRLRSRGKNLPTLVVTARDALESRVTALNSGADDYIIKPFELVELEARLRSLLRRAGPQRDLTHSCGNLTFTPVGQHAAVDGNPLELTRGEAALLEELLRTPGRTIVRDTLSERLYSFDEIVSRNALEALVSRLRKKLAASGATVEIETKRGIGYRMVASESR
jgi:two-component system OmpR family response regulator